MGLPSPQLALAWTLALPILSKETGVTPSVAFLGDGVVWLAGLIPQWQLGRAQPIRGPLTLCTHP